MPIVRSSSLVAVTIAVLGVASLQACSSSGDAGANPSGGGGAGVTSSTPTSSTTSTSTSTSTPDSSSTASNFSVSASGSGGAMCTPPDMLIALDRTRTMHKDPAGNEPTDAPAYASAKWSIAIGAIKALVAPPNDAGIRFGLELWPKNEPECVTLSTLINPPSQGITNNASCEMGEVLAPPADNDGATIQALLDPATTPLCFSTPTGNGLLTGQQFLDTVKTPGRDQYLMLVTDGADWDQTCPDPSPITVAKQIAADGIKTFVVGLSAQNDLTTGEGLSFLNQMACAGQTATSFATSCALSKDGSGYEPVDPNGATPLYLLATDMTSLTSAIKGVAAQVCCDCVK